MRVASRRWFSWLFRGVVVYGLTAAIGLLGLLVLDYTTIGWAPARCDRTPNWQADGALVLSGAPKLRRTRVAVAALRDGHLPWIMISGAGSGGDNSGVVARQAIADLDVPADRFRLETHARSTADNLRMSCPLLVAADADRVALVTDSWHALRALRSGQALCRPVTFCSLPAEQPLTPERRRSETLALFAYQLMGQAAWF